MRHLVLAAAAAAGLGACASMTAPTFPAADPVIASERAFAAEGAAIGWIEAFKKYQTADAVMIDSEIVNSRKLLESLPPAANTKNLAWWPVAAGIARSGDLGFTTGPYSADGKRFGHFFTVWKKQPDGNWRWIFDGGVPNRQASAQGPGSPVAVLNPGGPGAGSAEKAIKQVAALETTLHAGAAQDAQAAYKAVLAPDARVQGSPAGPAITAEAVTAELATRGAKVTCRNLAAHASGAGDLVFTYGEAALTLNNQERRGFYARIWQARGKSFALVFDQIYLLPPPKA